MYKLLPLLIAVFAVGAFAQAGVIVPPVLPMSKVAQMGETPGSLIQKQVTEVGYVRGVRVQAITVTDLTTGERASGVRFESSAAHPTMIDAAEVDSLSRAIEVLRTNLSSTFPEVYTSIGYTARDGFTVGASFVDRAWHASVKTDKFDTSPAIPVRVEDLGQLLELLAQAKAKFK